MRTSLGKILQWVLLGVLFLGIPSALADPINTIAGGAALDQSSPRVWRHGTAALNNVTSTTTAAGEYSPFVKAILYGCDGPCTTLNAIIYRDPNNDAVSTSDNHISTASVLYGFNGTTWERLRTTTENNQNLTRLLATGQYLWTGTGTNYDAAREATSDSLTVVGMPASGNMLFNGTNWNRVRGVNTNTNAIADFSDGRGLSASGALALASGGNTTVGGWNHLRTASAGNLTTTTLGPAILATAPVSTWSVTNTPAAAAQATASQAAGAAGVRHVATTVTACLAAGATAQTPVVVNLRDGATGAGTVLRSWAISAPVNSSQCVDLPGLAMLGTAATAMTIEFAAAGAAGTQETVTLTGFSTN